MLPLTALLLAAAGSSSTSPSITLWNSGVWPFAQRPWIALLEKEVPFQHNLIDLGNKPQDFVAKYREASGGYGSGLVPLLEHDGNLVIESDVVAKYVALNIDGIDGKGDDLYPSEKSDGGNYKDDAERIELFLESWQKVTDSYYDLLRATSAGEAEKLQKSFLACLSPVEDLLREQKGGGPESGPFILGNKFSHAECIAAPWIQRMYITLPYFRGIDFKKDILSLSRWECMDRWMSAVCERPSCVASRCPDGDMIEACKKYYVSYVSPGATGSL